MIKLWWGLAASMASISAYAQWDYQILMDDKNPAVAIVEVDTSSHPLIELIPSKSLHQSSYAVGVECLYPPPRPEFVAQAPDGLGITAAHVEQKNKLTQEQMLAAPDPAPYWLQMGYGTSLQCEKVRWKLTFEPVDENGFDISVQANSYTPSLGWHLISEWDSFPRLRGAQRGQICVEKERCYLLPREEQAALLFPVGMNAISLNIGKQPLTLYTDVKGLVEQADLWQPMLERQLLYLRGVFHARATQPVELIVVGKQTGELEGLSAYRTYLINWPLAEEGALSSQALKVLAQHTIKFISGLQAPLWLNESLTDYYAHKSLSDTEFALEDPLDDWRDFAAEMELNNYGLYQASRKVEAGQEKYQALFSSKGVAFWLELDLLLQRNGSSLDLHLATLKQLLAEQEPTKVSLPKAFVDSVKEIVGKKAYATLYRQYLQSIEE
ncbi:hypothetical protein [Vibrio sp. SCSIO 43136]|uniref:hypothetical protein n=1 Tax=Vibrio sp. SCSIO 43136 TaxID=2819101 RepID=UPI002075AF1E|nr:hypothetical protein [Vibrio sp. SCSIO 43136]USD67821.1 hypothetical protein J4N39_16675 [Vibrio sp. SCSIO 43136]